MPKIVDLVNRSEPVDSQSVASRQYRGRLPREEAQRRVQALLTLALGSFVDKGYTDTSLDGLVALSGVSKTTMLRHFGSKEGLFHAATKHSAGELRVNLAACELSPTDPEASFAQFAKALIDSSGDRFSIAVLRMVVAEKSRFPPLAHTAWAVARETFRPLQEYIALLMDNGVLEPGDPVEAAFEFVAMVHQGIRSLLDESDYRGGAERARAVARRFVRGRAASA